MKSGWRDTVKTVICKKEVNEKAWDSLTAAVDKRSFEKLDSIIGCPDCADGGAEWIQIEYGGKKKKVTFDYGNAPK